MKNSCLKHIISIFIITSLSSILSKSFLIGLLSGLTVSILKELYDRFIKSGKFDWMDIAVDMVGLILGLSTSFFWLYFNK